MSSWVLGMPIARTGATGLRIGAWSAYASGRQERIIDQVYREAAAIQVALGTQLPDLSVSVTPVICLHRGELPFFNKTVRGVRLASGRQLKRLIGEGDARLDSDEVQRIADVANRQFRPATD